MVSVKSVGFLAAAIFVLSSTAYAREVLTDTGSALVVGKFKSGKWTNEDACPKDGDGEELICLRFPNLAKFDHGKTIAGPVIGRRFTARIFLHSEPKKNIELAMMVRMTDGLYQVLEWDVIEKGRACFRVSSLLAAGIEIPAKFAAGRMQDDGEEVECLRLSS